MLSKIAGESINAHNLCIQQVSASIYREIYAALICAEPLPSSALKGDLQSAGLIHLLVVSGSHLIFLQTLLEKIFGKSDTAKLIVGIVLLGFTCISQWQPPVSRAFVNWLLLNVSGKLGLNWTGTQTAIAALLLCLASSPSWVDSLSLVLSSIAACALILVHALNWRSTSHFAIYIVLALPMLRLGVPNPEAILYNLILGPVLEMLLFPFALLASIFHALLPVSDFLLSRILSLPNLLDVQPQLLRSTQLPLAILWFYQLLLFMICWRCEQRRSQQKWSQ